MIRRAGRAGFRPAAIGVLSSLVLAGCVGGVDGTPVPTTAAEPFLCTGVPREGVELLSGVSDLRVSEGAGAWDDSAWSFACFVSTADDDGVVSVDSEPAVWHGFETAEDYLAQFEGSDTWVPIDGTGPGGGYAGRPSEDLVEAQWACGERRIRVTAFTVAGGGRDPVEDVSRLMVSMLPWACGDQDAPPRTLD